MLRHVVATMVPPPYALWMQASPTFRAWLTGSAVGCRGSWLVPTLANGSPAFLGRLWPSVTGSGGSEPWALQVVDISGAGSPISMSSGTPSGCSAFHLPRTSASRRCDEAHLHRTMTPSVPLGHTSENTEATQRTDRMTDMTRHREALPATSPPSRRIQWVGLLLGGRN